MLLNLNYDIQLYLLKHIVALDEETAKRDPNYYHDAVEFYQPRLTFWAKKGSIFSLSYVSRAVRDLVFPILFQQLDIDLHNLNLVDDQEYGLHTLYRCKKSAAFVRSDSLACYMVIFQLKWVYIGSSILYTASLMIQPGSLIIASSLWSFGFCQRFGL